MTKLFCIYFTILVFIFSTTNSIAQENYTIDGLLAGGNEETVVYFQVEGGSSDSTKLRQGHFALTGKIQEPRKCILSVKGQKGWASFILENGIRYQIEGKIDSMWKSKISGSKEIELTNELNAILKPALVNVISSSDSIRMAQIKKDTAAYNRYSKMHLNHRFDLGALRKAFILKYNDNYTSLFTFEELKFSIGITEQREVFNQLSPRLQNHSIGQRQYYRIFLRDSLTRLKASAMPISQRDTSRQVIRFDSIKAKVLIIDFWASWCGPCRAEHPHLKAVYEKYHDAGLEILGVSLDKDRGKWINAISEDGLPWLQVSDLVGNANEAAIRYGIESIPANFILDQQKIIVAKRLRGNALDEKLKELFGQQ